MAAPTAPQQVGMFSQYLLSRCPYGDDFGGTAPAGLTVIGLAKALPYIIRG